MSATNPFGYPFSEAEPALRLRRGEARSTIKRERRRPSGNWKRQSGVVTTLNEMSTYLILGVFLVNRRTHWRRNFEEEWPVYAKRPTKPVFGRVLSFESVEVLLHDIDRCWTYARPLFIDPIICLDIKKDECGLIQARNLTHQKMDTIWRVDLIVDIGINLLDNWLK